MTTTQLIDRFQKARRDSDLAVIEGVQALKHAARFKAEFEHVITCDIKHAEYLLAELAPDISQMILSQIEEVSEAVFQKLSPQPPRTKVIAIAKRKQYDSPQLATDRPVVFLEDPRDLENIGAVIRASAAADAAAVIISGPVDIWHPAVIRGAAGLHFAIPVLNENFDKIADLPRKVIALDPEGTAIEAAELPLGAVLVFGTERHGLSKSVLRRSDVVIRLPMKAGVSSLNLATSVAATLYSLG